MGLRQPGPDQLGSRIDSSRDNPDLSVEPIDAVELDSATRGLG